MSERTASLVAFVVGGLFGVALGSHLTDSDESPQINALKNEKQAYVFSGQGGQVSCDKSDDPITSGQTFYAKDIAPDAKLRQLLKIDIGKGTCTVQLKP